MISAVHAICVWRNYIQLTCDIKTRSKRLICPYDSTANMCLRFSLVFFGIASSFPSASATSIFAPIAFSFCRWCFIRVLRSLSSLRAREASMIFFLPCADMMGLGTCRCLYIFHLHLWLGNINHTILKLGLFCYLLVNTSDFWHVLVSIFDGNLIIDCVLFSRGLLHYGIESLRTSSSTWGRWELTTPNLSFAWAFHILTLPSSLPDSTNLESIEYLTQKTLHVRGSESKHKPAYIANSILLSSPLPLPYPCTLSHERHHFKLQETNLCIRLVWYTSRLFRSLAPNILTLRSYEPVTSSAPVGE